MLLGGTTPASPAVAASDGSENDNDDASTASVDNGSLQQNQRRMQRVTKRLGADMDTLVGLGRTWRAGVVEDHEQQFVARRKAAQMDARFRSMMAKVRHATSQLIAKALGDDKLNVKLALRSLHDWLDTESSSLLFFDQQLDGIETALYVDATDAIAREEVLRGDLEEVQQQMLRRSFNFDYANARIVDRLRVLEMELVPPLRLVPVFHDDAEELEEVVAVKVELLRKDVQVRIDLISRFLLGTLEDGYAEQVLKQTMLDKFEVMQSVAQLFAEEEPLPTPLADRAVQCPDIADTRRFEDEARQWKRSMRTYEEKKRALRHELRHLRIQDHSRRRKLEQLEEEEQNRRSQQQRRFRLQNEIETGVVAAQAHARAFLKQPFSRLRAFITATDEFKAAYAAFLVEERRREMNQRGMEHEDLRSDQRKAEAHAAAFRAKEDARRQRAHRRAARRRAAMDRKRQRRCVRREREEAAEKRREAREVAAREALAMEEQRAARAQHRREVREEHARIREEREERRRLRQDTRARHEDDVADKLRRKALRKAKRTVMRRERDEARRAEADARREAMEASRRREAKEREAMATEEAWQRDVEMRDAEARARSRARRRAEHDDRVAARERQAAERKATQDAKREKRRQLREEAAAQKREAKRLQRQAERTRRRMERRATRRNAREARHAEREAERARRRQARDDRAAAKAQLAQAVADARRKAQEKHADDAQRQHGAQYGVARMIWMSKLEAMAQREVDALRVDIAALRSEVVELEASVLHHKQRREDKERQRQQRAEDAHQQLLAEEAVEQQRQAVAEQSAETPLSRTSMDVSQVPSALRVRTGAESAVSSWDGEAVGAGESVEPGEVGSAAGGTTAGTDAPGNSLFYKPGSVRVRRSTVQTRWRRQREKARQDAKQRLENAQELKNMQRRVDAVQQHVRAQQRSLLKLKRELARVTKAGETAVRHARKDQSVRAVRSEVEGRLRADTALRHAEAEKEMEAARARLAELTAPLRIAERKRQRRELLELQRELKRQRAAQSQRAQKAEQAAEVSARVAELGREQKRLRQVTAMVEEAEDARIASMLPFPGAASLDEMLEMLQKQRQVESFRLVSASDRIAMGHLEDALRTYSRWKSRADSARQRVLDWEETPATSRPLSRVPTMARRSRMSNRRGSPFDTSMLDVADTSLDALLLHGTDALSTGSLSSGDTKDDDEAEIDEELYAQTGDRKALQHFLHKRMSRRWGLVLNDVFDSTQDLAGPATATQGEAREGQLPLCPRSMTGQELLASALRKPRLHSSARRLFLAHGTGPNITTAVQVSLRNSRFVVQRKEPPTPKGLRGVQLSSPRHTDGGPSATSPRAHVPVPAPPADEPHVRRPPPKSLARIRSYRSPKDAPPRPRAQLRVAAASSAVRAAIKLDRRAGGAKQASLRAASSARLNGVLRVTGSARGDAAFKSPLAVDTSPAAAFVF